MKIIGGVNGFLTSVYFNRSNIYIADFACLLRWLPYMVYKKFIKRGGKVFGPYYYESYRDSDGSVKTRYLENYPTEKKSYLGFVLFILAFSALLIGLGFFSNFTGNAIIGFDSASFNGDVRDFEASYDSNLNSYALTGNNSEMLFNYGSIEKVMIKAEPKNGYYDLECFNGEDFSGFARISAGIVENFSIPFDCASNLSLKVVYFSGEASNISEIANESINESLNESIDFGLNESLGEELNESDNSSLVSETQESLPEENLTIEVPVESSDSEENSSDIITGNVILDGDGEFYEIVAYPPVGFGVQEFGVMGERGSAVADDNVSVYRCGTVNTSGVYYLNQSIVADADPCIDITAADVTLDGIGFMINVSAQKAVRANGVNNITIQNFVINGDAGAIGVNLDFASNSYVINNSINDTGWGIVIDGSNNVHMDNNILSFCGTVGLGVAMNNPLDNLSVTNFTANNCGWGILIVNSNNNYFQDIVVNNNSNAGVESVLYGTNYTFVNLTANNNGNGSVFVGSDIEIINSSYDSNSDNGIYMSGGSNSVSGTRISNSGSNGIYFGAGDNIVSDSNISGSVSYDIYLSEFVTNNTFLNCTYSSEWLSPGGQSSMVRKWYYRAYVNDSEGNPVSGAYVNASNSTGWSLFNVTTGVDGYTNTTPIIDYVRDEIIGGYFSYYSNYTINASSTNYTSHEFNSSLGNNLEDVFTINQVVGIPGVTIVSPTNTTYGVDNYLVNISLNETGNCTYSLDGGVTNKSLTSVDNLSFSATETSVANGNYVLSAYCNNSGGNSNNSINISFEVSVSSPPGCVSNCGGGPGCTVSSWTNGSWGGCINGTQTLISTSNCGTTRSYLQDCGSCTLGWVCGDWSECIGLKQQRSCVNGCSDQSNKPETIRDCRANCSEDWNCSWSSCINGFYTPSCADKNNCGSDSKKPEKIACNESDDKCTPDIHCNSWTNCEVDYNFRDLLGNVSAIGGKQSRVCSDSSDCLYSSLDVKGCSVKIGVYAKARRICGENYIEIYRKDTNEFVSLMKDSSDKKIPSLDIDFLTGNSQKVISCDGCENKIRDGDETGVDCGGKCGACVETPYMPTKNFWWLILLLIIIWLTLFYYFIREIRRQ